MAFDLSDLMAIALKAALVLLFAAVVLVVCGFLIHACTILIRAWWQSRKRLLELGGVTTLAQTLSYNCPLCQDSMEAGEKVRTLSCDHAFHCGAIAKCANGIDQWLRAGPTTTPCPICRQIPQPVPQGKQPPRSSPATSTLGLELPRAHGGETLPESSSSAQAPPRAQPPRDSEEELPLLPRDETLPEAASSPPAPPLEQSPQDLEAALRLPADEKYYQMRRHRSRHA